MTQGPRVELSNSPKATPVLASQEIVDQLRQPDVYPDRPHKVSVVETHISWVFLTDRYAYKLKKPVKYDFLDFSTLGRRHDACLQEVALNRRLAPDVYLGVIPITSTAAGHVQIAGKGSPIEWLVRMHRLPANRSLDKLVTDRKLKDTEIKQLSRQLMTFYRDLPPLSLRAEPYRQRIEEHVKANRDELLNPIHELDAPQVKRIHAAQLRTLRLCPDAFDNRVRDGRIVEGHGDLRPEHIYLNPTPNIIDCIEFNADFRQLDVLDELSFLAVECAALGAKDVGGRILDDYLNSSGDQPPRNLLPFYMSYRASVRAKVHALRAQQVATAACDIATKAAGDYLALADSYAEQLGPPLLVIVRGVSGTGKSTLATALSKSLGIELMQTDSIRRELFRLSKPTPAFNQDRYRPENRRKVYDELFERARVLLGNGSSAILDGTFLSSDLRARAMLLARHYDAVPVIVECACPMEVATARISKRLKESCSLSEAQPELLRHQKTEEEADPPGVVSCQLDTTASMPELLERIYEHLRMALGLCE